MLDNLLVSAEVCHLKNVLLRTYVDVDDREVVKKNYQYYLCLMMMELYYMMKNQHKDLMVNNDLETYFLCFCCSYWGCTSVCENAQFVYSHKMVGWLTIFFFRFESFLSLLYLLSRWLTPMIGSWDIWKTKKRQKERKKEHWKFFLFLFWRCPLRRWLARREWNDPTDIIWHAWWRQHKKDRKEYCSKIIRKLIFSFFKITVIIGSQ